jgi:S-adenosyl methyltransferase
VYVDYDPVVALHGKAPLASAGDVEALHADLTEPSSVLEHPDLLRVLDLSQPVGLIVPVRRLAELAGSGHSGRESVATR